MDGTTYSYLGNEKRLGSGLRLGSWKCRGGGGGGGQGGGGGGAELSGVN